MKPNRDSQSVFGSCRSRPLDACAPVAIHWSLGAKGVVWLEEQEKFWGEAQWHAFYALPDPVGSKRAKGKGVLQSGANRALSMKDFMRF